MEYVTTIADWAPIAVLSVPIVLGALALVLAVCTGAAGRVVVLIQDLLARERVDTGC